MRNFFIKAAGIAIILFFIFWGIAHQFSKKQIRENFKTENIASIIKREKAGGTFLVTRVIDGDTIEIEGGEKLRYIGMDTPETVDPRKPIQCFGEEASKKNKELVEGKMVRLEKDVTELDKYGRLLRYVYADNIFVNLLLVQEGFAHSYAYPPNVKYQSRFIAAERLARKQKKGLWGACPATI